MDDLVGAAPQPRTVQIIADRRDPAPDAAGAWPSFVCLGVEPGAPLLVLCAAHVVSAVGSPTRPEDNVPASSRYSPVKTTRLTLPSPRGVYSSPSKAAPASSLETNGHDDDDGDARVLALDEGAARSLDVVAGDTIFCWPAPRVYALAVWECVEVTLLAEDPRCRHALPAPLAHRHLAQLYVLRRDQIVLLPTETGDWRPYRCNCRGAAPDATFGLVSTNTRVSVTVAPAEASPRANFANSPALAAAALTTFSPALHQILRGHLHTKIQAPGPLAGATCLHVHGAAGLGKSIGTVLAAQSLGAAVVVYDPLAVEIGESAVTRVVHAAIQQQPVVLIFDPANLFFPVNPGPDDDCYFETFRLAALIETLHTERVVVVLISEKIQDIPAALRHRVDVTVVVEPPSEAHRRLLVAHYLPDADASLIDRCAAVDMAGLTGAAIQSICQAALQFHATGEVLAVSVAKVLRECTADFQTPGAHGTWQKSRNTFAHLVGLDDVKQQLDRGVLAYMRNPAAYLRVCREAPRGVFISGVSGSGKSLLARCVAGELGLLSRVVTVQELTVAEIGEAEKALARLFDEAGARAPCVLIFDDIDALFGGERGGGTQSALVATLVSCLDRLAPGVLVLATSSRPAAVASCLLQPWRLGLAVYTRLPTTPERVALLQATVARLPGGALPDVDFAELAAATRRQTSADLLSLVRFACTLSGHRNGGDCGPAEFAPLTREALLAAAAAGLPEPK